MRSDTTGFTANFSRSLGPHLDENQKLTNGNINVQCLVLDYNQVSCLLAAVLARMICEFDPDFSPLTIKVEAG